MTLAFPSRSCPECATSLPIVQGYVTWCHQCSWNLSAPAQRAPRTRLERVEARAGRRFGVRLAERLATRAALEPHLSAAKLAAYAIAVVVHLVAVGFLAAAIAIAVIGGFSVGAIVIALIVAAPAVLMRPRFGKLEKEARVVARADAPQLYAFVDEVAAAAGGKPPGLIVVDIDYNAAWGVIGWRRRRVLWLGLPLLTALAPAERVAIVAHEIAHGRNGDATRGFIVGGATQSLADLYYLVRPGRQAHGVELIVNALFYLLSRPLWWLLVLEFYLLRRDSQRAEFLADALAAETAGTTAVIALHERLLLDSALRGAVQLAAREQDVDLFERLLQTGDVPERERERRRRVARLEDSTLGGTHPPTGHRIELLERRDARPPKVVLDPAVSAAIDEELRPFRAPFQHDLVERYRASLYR